MSFVPKILGLIFLVAPIWTFPFGAPNIACSDMIPLHGVEPQASELPQSVSVEPSAVAAAGSANITITGPAFKGHLVQVRDEAGAIVGTFNIATDDPNAQTLDCTVATDSATHKDSLDKTTVSLEWVAPNTAGTYVVFVSIVQDFLTFWANLPTAQITVA